MCSGTNFQGHTRTTDRKSVCCSEAQHNGWRYICYYYYRCPEPVLAAAVLTEEDLGVFRISEQLMQPAAQGDFYDKQFAFPTGATKTLRTVTANGTQSSCACCSTVRTIRRCIRGPLTNACCCLLLLLLTLKIRTKLRAAFCWYVNGLTI